MKQRYREYSHDLAVQAVLCCFDRKWARRDVLAMIEEYAGIDRSEVYGELLDGSVNVRLEAADAIACLIDNMVEDILTGHDPEEVAPVAARRKADGMTGKIRDIACLSLPHQLLEHVAKLCLQPLLDARILPTQHASIPGRGQTRLKNQTARALRRHGKNIRCFVKTDNVSAYGTLMYADVITIIGREIPSAATLLTLLQYLARLAPGGHLIIGGYLDAWLYNLTMSYALRHVLGLRQVRRGVALPLVTVVENYMDDCCLCARSPTAAKKALRALSEWMRANLHMRTKQTTAIVKLLPEAQERQHRREKKRSRRGCPGIDMGGYVIHRTYITIRPRVFKRVVRTFLRAWLEMQATGTLHLQRAKAVIARYGPIKQSDGEHITKQYYVKQIVDTAKRVCAWHGREAERKRKEFYRNASKIRIYRAA